MRCIFGITVAAGILAVALPLTAQAQCSSSKSGAGDTAGNTGHVTMVAGMTASGKDIVDTAVGAGDFTTLATALKAAGLVDALKGDGPFTVFAPTDEAFSKLPKGTLDALLKPENRDTLKLVLTYHVVSGRVTASDVVKLSNATTLAGQRIDIKANGGKVMIDESDVVKADIICSNGVIHVVDRVLLPATDDIVETAVKNGSFKTLASLLTQAGLVSALQADGPFTVFAPTDEAFAKLPKATVAHLTDPANKAELIKVLKYHVVQGRVYGDQAAKLSSAPTLAGENLKISKSGQGLMINNATVKAADIETSNGVIHVIDTVLVP